jgi:multidrug resistance efflux pump
MVNRLYGVVAAIAVLALSTTATPAVAQQTTSADSLQAQIKLIHLQISGLGLRALDTDNANVNDIERQLLDLQKRMHAIAEAAAEANLAYLHRTTHNSKAYLIIMQQADLLDAEADAIDNFLDTQDPMFSALIPDLERLANRIEP